MAAAPSTLNYATRQPDPEGNVTYVWNFSSSSTFPSLAFVAARGAERWHGARRRHLRGRGSGILRPSLWGDYTAVAPAGLAAGRIPKMWFAGMVARSDGTWGTAIGRNGYTSITQP
jgi:hypothetical protein